jgi:nicotinamide mononucleotide (NMN) deamidase PncC
MDPELIETAARVLDANRAVGRCVATAESCTGGLVAAALTEVAGASDIVDRGFVTYSNEAKMEMLGVGPSSSPAPLAMATPMTLLPTSASSATSAAPKSAARRRWWRSNC